MKSCRGVLFQKRQFAAEIIVTSVRWSPSQNTRSIEKAGMMGARYDGQQLSSAVDVRDWSGQSRTAAAERVFGDRKPYPEGALAGSIALIRSGTIHARRN